MKNDDYKIFVLRVLSLSPFLMIYAIVVNITLLCGAGPN